MGTLVMFRLKYSMESSYEVIRKNRDDNVHCADREGKGKLGILDTR